MGEPTAAHGYELDADLHEQLRDDPPAEVLEWVRRESGARRVISVTALHGGTSSAVHLVVLELGPGAQRALVLRRYVLDWVVDEPEAPANEARILALLEGHPEVPAPRLVAADVDGSVTGTPAILMTARAGEIVWRPADPDRWLDALVQTVVAIHEIPPGPDLARWAPYGPEQVPPPWTTQPQAWQRALDAYAGPTPDSAPVFLHRDFHPGNVLFTDDAVTGVVDWVSSCVGPAEEDLAHCRANLALHAFHGHGRGSFELADEFLLRWQRATGRTQDWDPYWDLVNLVSCGSTEPQPALDAWVARVSRA